MLFPVDVVDDECYVSVDDVDGSIIYMLMRLMVSTISF